MTGVSNAFVRDTLRVLTPDFEDCFSCEKLKSYTLRGLKQEGKRYGYLVVNTAPLSRSKGHFIAVIHDKSKKVIFVFDPLGMDDQDPWINRYLAKMYKQHRFLAKFSFNATQHYTSKMCAFHCMSFILYHAKKKELFEVENFFNHFTFPPSLKNDTIAVNKILKYISDI